MKFEDFKVIVADVYKFPEINGEFIDESSDFIDRILYKWVSETSYTTFDIEYDSISPLSPWIVDRGRGTKGIGSTLTEAVINERKNNGYEPIKFSFREFQTIVISQWKEAEDAGLFLDESNIYNYTDSTRCVFSWCTYPKGSSVVPYDLVEYDSAALNRWKLTRQNEQVYGQTLRQALANN